MIPNEDVVMCEICSKITRQRDGMEVLMGMIDPEMMRIGVA